MNQVIKAAEEIFLNIPEFKLLADAMPQIVWLADENGVTYYYNARWYEFIGSEEGHDKEPYFYSHVLHPEDSRSARELWVDCVKTQTNFNTEYRFIDKKTGDFRWFLARAHAVKDAKGKVTWYGTYTDIDEQKRSQILLKEALQFRDEFLSIAGHELKTPLTTLRLQVQHGLRSLKSGKDLSSGAFEKILSTCFKQSNRLAALVDGFLESSRLRRGYFNYNVESVNLSDVIRSLSQEMKLQGDELGSSITVDLPEKLEVTLDSKRIEQVLLNLYMNSFKYAPGTAILIKGVDGPDHVVITYQDEGPGIELTLRERLFERYERATGTNHISGLGLGLFISKKIIEGHEGSLKLLDTDGPGATFEITLPKKTLRDITR